MAVSENIKTQRAFLQESLFLARFQGFLSGLFNFAIAHSKFVFCGLVLILAVCPFGLVKTRLLISIDEMNNTNSKVNENRKIRDENFSNSRFLFVTFMRSDSNQLSDYDLCFINAWAMREKKRSRYLGRIYSLFDVREIIKKNKKFENDPIVRLGCDRADSNSLKRNFALGSFATPPFLNLFVSPDGKSLSFVFGLKDTFHNSFFGEFDHRPISDFTSILYKGFPENGEYKVSVTGADSYEWHYWKSIVKDQRLNLLTLIVLIIIFRVLFGTWRGGFLLSAMVGTTSLIVFSMMGFFGARIDVLTNGMMMIIALSTTEDFVYLSQLKQDEAHLYSNNWKTHFVNLLMPSLLTSLTTVLGFGSLLFSSTESIQTFGLWAAVGALVEWILVFFFLPATINIFPCLQKWTGPRRGYQLRLKEWTPSGLNRKVIPVFHVVLGLSFFAIFLGNGVDSIDKTWAENHSFNQGLESVKENLGWATYLELNFKDRSNRRLNATISNEVKSLPEVKVFEEPGDFSLRGTQSLSSDEIDYFEFFINFSNLFERYFGQENKMLRKFIYLESVDSRSVNRFIQSVEKICKENCFLTGKAYSHAVFSKDIFQNFKQSFLICLVLIGLFLFFVCRLMNQKVFYFISYSSMWGVIIFIGIVPYFFGGVNFVTCVFASVLLGLAGDNGIQYLFAGRNSNLLDGVKARQTSSIQVTIIMVSVSFVFLRWTGKLQLSI